MRYEYLADDDSGDIELVDRPMSEAPDLGHKIRRGGRTFRRVLSVPVINDRRSRKGEGLQMITHRDFGRNHELRGKDGKVEKVIQVEKIARKLGIWNEAKRAPVTTNGHQEREFAAVMRHQSGGRIRFRDSNDSAESTIDGKEIKKKNAREAAKKAARAQRPNIERAVRRGLGQKD